MKTSIRTIIIIIILFATSGLAFAQNSSTGTVEQAIPDQPVRRPSETNAAFQARLRAWEAQVRNIKMTNQQNDANFPEPPEQRPGESDPSYAARLRTWQAQMRSIVGANSENTASVSSRLTPPVRRAGESDANYQARLRAFESEARRLSAIADASQLAIEEAKSKQIMKLQEDLQRAMAASRSSSSSNILVIPTEEMKTESLLSINEDMNIMSRILMKELLNQEIVLPASSSSALGGLFTSNYETNSGLAANMLNSMYLQGYGALFQLKANFAFPLSSPPEMQEKPEQTKNEGVDDVWQQTKNQLYEPQKASANFGSTDSKQNAQRVENLKNSFVKTLKYASNIRALQPDESVILRISEISPFRSPIKAILGDQYFINGKWVPIDGKWVLKEDLPDNIKLLPLNAIVIRAKKSDIDAFAKGELDFEKFREKVQIFSYPQVSGNSDN